MRNLILSIFILMLVSLAGMTAFAQEDNSDGEPTFEQMPLRYVCDATDECTWTPLSEDDLNLVDPDNTYEEAEPKLKGDDGERFVCVGGLGCYWSPLSDTDLAVAFPDTDYWIADYNGVPEGEWAFSDESVWECSFAMMSGESTSEGEMTIAPIDDDGTRLQVIANSTMTAADADAAAGGMSFNYTMQGGQSAGTVVLGNVSETAELPIPVDDGGEGSMIFYRIGPGTYTTGVQGMLMEQEGSEGIFQFESFLSMTEEDTLRGTGIFSMNLTGQGMEITCDATSSVEAVGNAE